MTKPINPDSNRFVTDNDPALCQKVLDITQAHGKTEVRPDRIGNDFAGWRNPFRGMEIAGYIIPSYLPAQRAVDNIDRVWIAVPPHISEQLA